MLDSHDLRRKIGLRNNLYCFCKTGGCKWQVLMKAAQNTAFIQNSQIYCFWLKWVKWDVSNIYTNLQFCLDVKIRSWFYVLTRFTYLSGLKIIYSINYLHCLVTTILGHITQHYFKSSQQHFYVRSWHFMCSCSQHLLYFHCSNL